MKMLSNYGQFLHDICPDFGDVAKEEEYEDASYHAKRGGCYAAVRRWGSGISGMPRNRGREGFATEKTYNLSARPKPMPLMLGRTW